MMASIFGLARICRKDGAFGSVAATVSRATLNARHPRFWTGRGDTGTTLVDSTKQPVAPSRAHFTQTATHAGLSAQIHRSRPVAGCAALRQLQAEIRARESVFLQRGTVQ